MTFAEIEKIYLDQMPGFYDHEEIKAIASLAVQHVCNISNSYYHLHKNRDLLLAQETSLIRILDELRFGKPVQHVLGVADFYGLRFKVNSAVLVPRPETEELVDWILSSIKEGILPDRILDIGTGSGCIPIALKKNVPASEIFAMDISIDALKVAHENCILNQVKINLLEGDILDANFKIPGSGFNIIVSNPPYITHREKEHMHPNVLDHDPHDALFVPDNNPLIFYDAIAKFSGDYLSQGGYLFLEINENLGDETVGLLEKTGFKAEIKKDLQGKNRMIKALKIIE
ncbi:peptide chain release factor N(5)-glutamine methyltransferase [Pedobacter sp. P351]|uniref:peptide chain release factor N(5)-glutamine methyltransferase n=1 Tax=Pedobacter superstes TaxID=3133441 RepID=UPI0030A0D8F4